MNESFLASYAVKNSDLKGRIHEEVFFDQRGAFERDLGRIIHSKAFRRLEAKTQVFRAGSGDHYRTRLTHSLEVAQVARGIARRLRLNEELCEAIALAHDLGHPPFGHAGEYALDEMMQGFGLHFEHNEQSKRIVELLELSYPHFPGLNLTLEVLEGMEKHQTAYDQKGKSYGKFAHLEAQVVNLADEIAYTNHDIDDGLRSGFVKLEELDKLAIWRLASEEKVKRFGKIENEEVNLDRTISVLIGLMIGDLTKESERRLAAGGIISLVDVQNFEGELIGFSAEMKAMIAPLRAYLYEEFYLHPEVVAVTNEGQRMIKKLFLHLMEERKVDPVEVKDYIAGMTDSFLLKAVARL